MKILVTGAPGTGKTALVEYAIEQGRKNFFDTDEVKGLCEWREYASGKLIGPVEVVMPKGNNWYEKNGWYWVDERLQAFMKSIQHPVICGSADNIQDFYKEFDVIVLLYKSQEDIVKNLMQPGREQPNGKDPAHHERVLKWQDYLYKSLLSFEPVLIRDNNISNTYKRISKILNS